MNVGQRYVASRFSANPGLPSLSPPKSVILIATPCLVFFLCATACLAFEDPSPQKLFSQKTVAEVRPAAAKTPSPAAPANTVFADHAVVAGETLYSLGRRYGVSQDALMAANGLDDPKALRAGMRLRLPGRPRAAPARKSCPAPSAKSAKRSAVPPDPCRALKTPDIHPGGVIAGIADPSPGPKPPLSIPTIYKVSPTLTIEPEYKNAGATLLANPGGDFGGYGAGLKASFTTQSGANFVGMFGYSLDFSASENPDKALGRDAAASIGGLGAGVGLRRSF